MRKRLKKKKHIGPFKRWGVDIAIFIRQDADVFAFLDDFSVQAIEPNGCSYGGGGNSPFEAFIDLGRTCNDPPKKLALISEWLDARSDISGYKCGKLVDAWYGPFE